MFKNLKLDKRVYVAAGLICLLVVVAVVNQVVNQNQGQTPTPAGTNSAAAFAAYRSERAMTRTNEVEYLDSVIANADTTTETRDEAQQKKLALTATMESESNIETILRTKGLTDCIVSISKEACNVMVNLPELSVAQVAQVVDAVTANSEMSAEQIKIVPSQ